MTETISGRRDHLRAGDILKILSVTVLSIVFVDQITKVLVTHYLALNETREVIPGFFNIVYFKNPGAAFGFLRYGGIVRTAFLIAISLAALVVIGILLRQSKDPLSAFSLSMIAGGAVGNLIDRVRLGEVVDFVDFYIGPYHWPAFNVADTAITVGVALSIFCFYFKKS